jgi:membrane protein involved in colicin uptake
MPKPILELVSELQDAVEAAEQDQVAVQTLAAKHAQVEADAKAKYEATVAASKADYETASKAFADSAANVRRLQDDLNSLLGRFDPRLRQG